MKNHPNITKQEIASSINQAYDEAHDEAQEAQEAQAEAQEAQVPSSLQAGDSRSKIYIHPTSRSYKDGTSQSFPEKMTKD